MHHATPSVHGYVGAEVNREMSSTEKVDTIIETPGDNEMFMSNVKRLIDDVFGISKDEVISHNSYGGIESPSKKGKLCIV